MSLLPPGDKWGGIAEMIKDGAQTKATNKIKKDWTGFGRCPQ